MQLTSSDMKTVSRDWPYSPSSFKFGRYLEITICNLNLSVCYNKYLYLKSTTVLKTSHILRLCILFFFNKQLDFRPALKVA